MSGAMIFVTILIAMSIAHMEIGRGMMVIGGWVIGFMVIRLWMIGFRMIGLRMVGFIVMIGFMMIRLWMIGRLMIRLWMIRLMMVGLWMMKRVYMVGLRVVDTMMTEGAQAVELRAMSMNFPKKSKVRPG